MSNIRELGNGSTQVGGITVNTPYEDKKDQGVKVDDFLQLMIAQMSNQDFMNPADDTQYVTQMAQFATMEAMQELSHYSQINYVSSMVGKTVTAASYGLGGNVSKEVGTVSKVNLSGDDFTVTVNGKEYKLNQIMSMDDPAANTDKKDLESANKIALISKEVGKDYFSFRWSAPAVDEATQSGLRYDVYYTDDENADFSDLNTVKKGKRAASGITDLDYKLTGLESGTKYYVNVVVRNAAGDEAVYQKATVITNPS